MRFTAFVVSLLATNAVAKRSQCGHKPVAVSESAASATFTPGVHTPGPFTPSAYHSTEAEKTPIPTPTTLITRKISSSSSTQEASSASTMEKASSTSTTSTAAAQSTTASATSTSTSTLTDDQQSALDAHNAARSAVGVPDMSWDADLASDAQTWATHLASIDSLTHSSVEDQGENLYQQTGTDSAYTNAVTAFVAEKSEYNGEAITSTNYLTFGHYTQVVWKSTTKLGMALATSSTGNTYVVARYYTPGNYVGETPY